MLRVIIALISLFLITEAGFRYYHFGVDGVFKFWEYTPRGITISKFVEHDQNPKVGYRLSPNTKGLFKAAPLSINALGFRGDESTIEKPAHTYRIASLGPSIAMGAGVSNKQTYAQLLENRLNETFPFSIEIQNHAVGGYKALQIEASFWQSVDKFKPDLVLLPVYPKQLNQQFPPHQLRDPNDFCFEIRCHLQDYYSLNALSYLARDFTRGLQKIELFGVGKHWKPASKERQEKSKKILKESAILKRFITDLKAAGYKVVILRLPTLEGYLTKQKERAVNLAWERWLTKNNPTLVIDTSYSVKPKISLNDKIYLGDNHPNPRVHLLYADAIHPPLSSFIEKAFSADEKNQFVVK